MIASTSKSRAYAMSAFGGGLHGERLHQIVVFELREDGTTEYSTMTLRALYNYVVRTITEACREANHESRQQHHNKQQRSNSSRKEFSRGCSYGDERSCNNDRSSSRIDVIVEEEPHNSTSSNGDSPNPTTPSSPFPPHLPSLTSSHATTPFSTGSSDYNHTSSLPTPIMSNNIQGDDTDEHEHDTPIQHHDDHNTHTQTHTTHKEEQRSKQLHVHYPPHHPQQRAAQTAFTPLPKDNGVNNTHRERLGGYLHPRDMRRLVTPFSSSNEPQLMVRRHVMLLNFDPLRAIVLRDRLLILVPDGADSILIELERRVRGGIVEMENQVFGSASGHDVSVAVSPPLSQPTTTASKSSNIKRNISIEKIVNKLNSAQPEESGKQTVSSSAAAAIQNHQQQQQQDTEEGYLEMDSHVTEETTTTISTDHSNDEWEDIQKMDWKHMPYELQSVDAVLQTVISMLMDDARKVHQRSSGAMSELRGEHKKGTGLSGGEHAQERLRLYKDEVNLMEGRVQGFVRAMNDILDDDEDMTLMNLSRLITHPERFLQPVSKEILHEESDEPELILEAYLQQALSIVNELDLLKGQIMTTEEQISMLLDAIRNRLLYINTLLSVASLCVALGSFVGSIFGMNLRNHIEEQPTAFVRVTVGVVVGMLCLWAILSRIFYSAANIHTDLGKKYV